MDGDVLSLAVEKSGGKEEKKEENGIKYHRYLFYPRPKKTEVLRAAGRGKSWM